MKFKEVNFDDESAQRIYIQYFDRVRNVIKSLSKESQNDILLEINSHIYESLLNSNKSEVENILDVTEKLGNPEVFLKELVGEKRLYEATKSFNPIKIFNALLMNITNGVSYIIFLILYLSLFFFIFLSIKKVLDPKNIGFYYLKNKFFVLGKLKSTSFNYYQYEQLGNWFIPVMIICSITLFFIITLLLRLKKQFQKTII